MTKPTQEEASTYAFREYNDATDKNAVSKMCKNVYDGTDIVPQLLTTYVNLTYCHPYVLTTDETVVAFFNIRDLRSDQPSQHTYYIESLRVAPSHLADIRAM